MPTWSTIVFNETALRGYAELLFRNRAGQVYDETLVLAALVTTSKVQTGALLVGLVPNALASYSTDTAFLDAVAGNETLLAYVYQLWAMEYLRLYIPQARWAGDDVLTALLDALDGMQARIVTAFKVRAEVLLGTAASFTRFPTVVSGSGLQDVWVTS